VIDRFDATRFDRQVSACTTNDATGSCRPICDIHRPERVASLLPNDRSPTMVSWTTVLSRVPGSIAKLKNRRAGSGRAETIAG
jgi:hypothetical protein